MTDWPQPYASKVSLTFELPQTSKDMVGELKRKTGKSQKKLCNEALALLFERYGIGYLEH